MGIGFHGQPGAANPLPGILESAAYGMCEMACEAAGLALAIRSSRACQPKLR
jgi:hypothetical protein